MRNILLLICLPLIMIVSCKKTEDVYIKLKSSGKLEVQIIDDEGMGMAGVRIYLNQYTDKNNPPILEGFLTDRNGVVNFGELNPSRYLLTSEGVELKNTVNTYSYLGYKFEMETGADKELIIKFRDHLWTSDVIEW